MPGPFVAVVPESASLKYSALRFVVNDTDLSVVLGAVRIGRSGAPANLDAGVLCTPLNDTST